MVFSLLKGVPKLAKKGWKQKRIDALDKTIDKVEKTKKSITDADIFWEYTKIFLFFLAGMAYAYFIILGKTLQIYI